MARDVFGDVFPEGRKTDPVLISPSTSGLLFQHWVIPCIVTEFQFLGEELFSVKENPKHYKVSSGCRNTQQEEPAAQRI